MKFCATKKLVSFTSSSDVLTIGASLSDILFYNLRVLLQHKSFLNLRIILMKCFYFINPFPQISELSDKIMKAAESSRSTICLSLNASFQFTATIKICTFFPVYIPCPCIWVEPLPKIWLIPQAIFSGHCVIIKNVLIRSPPAVSKIGTFKKK